MVTVDHYEPLIDELIKLAGDQDRIDVDEASVLDILSKIIGNRAAAENQWEILSTELRKRTVRNDFVVQWDMFRRAVRLAKLPSVQELESACELYQNSTPREIERRIRSLSGVEFETFLVSILGRLPDYREISTTRQSHDEGVDLQGLYVPSANGPICQHRRIYRAREGDAQQVEREGHAMGYEHSGQSFERTHNPSS